MAVVGIRQAGQADVAGPTAAATLPRVRIPVLYLLGSRARPWHRDGAQYLAEHLDDLRVVEIPGPGHFAPLLAPEALAAELVRFFTKPAAPR